MKKLFGILFISVLVFSLTAANDLQNFKDSSSPYSLKKANVNRDEEIIFEEDFEDGLGDWEYYDETAPDDWNEFWHLSTVGAYAGNSWWMGDEELGGYTSHRYLILDTPTITLAAADPELNFMFALNCEDPGVSDPYDAWDGANIRISTDNGSTWDVIEGTPAYNGDSFYSFGYEFNEGPGIPAWGSTTIWADWTAATFDLSAYAGQEVRIRFAFASDPAYDTADDPDMFGFKVDDIVIDTADGTFESDGDGAAGDAEMVASYGGDIAGNLWHIYTDNAAPSPTHAAGCFNDDTDTYYPNMSNFIVSPEYSLPADAELTWDIFVRTLLDDNTFPDCDYIHVEVNSQEPGGSWTGWNSISNPLGDPSGTNYVFTGAVDTWTPFTEGWGLEYADISMLAGRNVRFRFGLHSNGFDQVVPGGLRVDNFSITQQIFLGPAPENLAAETLPNNDVELTWDPAQIGGEEGWIGWDNGELEGYLGLTNPGEWSVASRFTASDMLPYVGGEITTIKFMPGTSTTSDYAVRIWTGSTSPELVSEEVVTNAVPVEWNEIELSTPVTIEEGVEFWIGYYINQVEVANPGGYSAGYDAGPSVAGLYINQGTGFSDISGDFDYNWLIQGLVVAEDGRTIELPVNNRSRELEGYRVWHSATMGGPYDLLDEVGVSNEPSYTHTDPIVGDFNYYVVTAVYDGNDSAESNEASTYVLGPYDELMYFDDGEAEDGYNCGQGNQMAVRYSPSYDNGTINVKLVQFYVETLNIGTTIFRIFDDNGENGMPGSNFVSQFAVSGELNAGWNTLLITESEQEEFSEGDFYLGILEISSPSSIGLDTDTSGNSYSTTTGSWEMLTEGNLMIRAIVEDVDVSSDDNDIPANVVTLSNYPNPFNPVTNIKFSIPASGNTTLKVYNTKGQLVKVLLDTYLEAGEMNLYWDGTDTQGETVTSGIYYYTLESGQKMISKKMILLK